METEKKQNDLASIEERIDPLLEVPEIETVQPQQKKDRSNEVYTEGKGENDMIAVPKKLDNIQKISEFDVINQDPSLKNYEWNIKHRLDHFHNQIEQIEKNEKSLMDFAHSYKTMGLMSKIIMILSIKNMPQVQRELQSLESSTTGTETSTGFNEINLDSGQLDYQMLMENL